MDELFARFATRYGHAWTSQYGNTDAAMMLAMAEWREALDGLSVEQVRVGLAADLQRGDEWPPSSARFRALCLGIPTFAAARFEMAHGDVPRTGFGLLCWRFIDTFRLRQADQREADRLARDAYDLAKAHLMAGGKLPEVHEALRAPLEPERKPAPPEVAKRHLDAMMATLADGPDSGARVLGDAA